MPLDGVPYRNAVKFAKILGNTERYTAPQMQAYQRRLLERLVRHAKAEVPFYEIRLNPLFGPKDEIRWDAWEDVPTFARAEALEAGDALFARNTPPQVGDYVVKTTSGSTGMPMSVRINAISSIMSAALNQRIFDWHGVDTDASIAFIFDLENAEYPEGITGEDWNLRNQKAIAYQLSIACTVDQQVEWLTRKKPGILSTFPQNARAIVEEMLNTDTPISFRTIIVHGEVLSSETKAFMANSGIKVIDRYGGEDIGPISADCSLGTGHHQFAEVSLFEMSEIQSAETADSKRGSLIATPFYNYSMPMIRYENRDIVEVSKMPCSCGRTLPKILKIMGRDRNMFTFSDGSQVWPDMTYAQYKDFLPAQQFQVIQHTHQDIEVIYVASPKAKPADKAGMQTLLRKNLHEDIDVRLTRVQRITRSSSGKFETWKSLV